MKVGKKYELQAGLSKSFLPCIFNLISFINLVIIIIIIIFIFIIINY